MQEETRLFKEVESHAAFLFTTVQLIYCFTATTTTQSMVRTVRLEARTVPVLGAKSGRERKLK